MQKTELPIQDQRLHGNVVESGSASIPIISKQKEWEQKFLLLAISLEHRYAFNSPNKFGFWTNPLNSSSLRLTRSGYTWLVNNTIPFWKSKISESMLPKTFLKLERALTSPYYIVNLLEIIVFSEADYIMLQLHAGDLERYLDNIIETNTE